MKIRMVKDGRRVLARPLQRIPGSVFSVYLAACRKAGFRFDPVAKCQSGVGQAIYEAIRELSVVGFEVSIDADVAAQLEQRRADYAQKAEAARELRDAALDRLERIDVELAKRGLALYPYQRQGVPWLAHRTGAGLFDEMGLGKTVQAIIAAPDGAPILVVAPASVKGVWYSEARRWRPDLGYPRILKGRKSFRWPRAGEVLITNYDILPDYTEPTGKGSRFKPDSCRVETWSTLQKGTVVIADECHLLKGRQTKRHRRFAVIARQVRRNEGRVWGLTGTPLLNRQDELWNVLDAIGIAGEIFGSKSAFYRLTNATAGLYGVEFGTTDPKVPKALQVATLMRRREDVLPDLPVKTYREVVVSDLDDAVRKLMDEFAAKLRAQGVEISQASLDDILAALKSQVVFEMMAKIRAALAKAKIPAALDHVEPFEDAGEPLVVFSAHRAPVQAIGSRPGWAYIDGSTPNEERTEIVRRLQEGELRGVAGTIKAAGVGLTMTKAHQVLFIDREWTPALNTQAEDRVCRIGQTRGVIITNLVAEHEIDQRLAELLTQKTEIIETTVNASARAEVDDGLDDLMLGAVNVTVEDSPAVAAQTAASAPTSDAAAIRELLDRAKASGIDQPTIRLDGLQLRMAGKYSRHAGSVYVSGGPSREDPFYGWIDTAGGWHHLHQPPDELVERMRAYNLAPERLIEDCVAFGLRTGACSFCGKALSDERSVTVGYGPICAERFGLPWGDERESRRVDFM